MAVNSWNAVTAIVLLNVLISLFSSAYAEVIAVRFTKDELIWLFHSKVIDDAEAQYLAFFANKTVGMIRAPDSYVYPAPFNLIEAFFIAPFELAFSQNLFLLNATNADFHDQVHPYSATIQCSLRASALPTFYAISII